jgi:hypothetical protein
MLNYNLYFENHEKHDFLIDDIKLCIESLIGFPASVSQKAFINYTISINPFNISRNGVRIFSVYSLYDYIFSHFPKLSNQNIITTDTVKYNDMIIDFINKLKLDNTEKHRNVVMISDFDTNNIPSYTLNTLFTFNSNIDIDNPLKYDKIYIIGFDIFNKKLVEYNHIELIDLSDFVSEMVYKNFYGIRS